MVHLNDSRSELGSNTDRHQHVGAGRIGPAGLARLLLHPGLGHVTFYIETPGMDEGYDGVNLERVRRLARGEPLPEMRPEELEMRGSRSRSAPVEDETDDETDDEAGADAGAEAEAGRGARPNGRAASSAAGGRAG
jgi:hypothetical protein